MLSIHIDLSHNEFDLWSVYILHDQAIIIGAQNFREMDESRFLLFQDVRDWLSCCLRLLVHGLLVEIEVI